MSTAYEGPSVTPRTGQFAGQTVYTNTAGRGLFTRRADGTYCQHTGTSQTPTFRSTSQLAAYLRRHYSTLCEPWVGD